MVGAPSGGGKSVCFDLVLAPLFEYEHRLRAEWKDNDRPRLLAAKVVIDVRVRRLRRQAAALEDEEELQRLGRDLSAAIEAREKLEAESAEPVLCTEDVTIEQLSVLLGQNGGTLLSASADARAVVEGLLGRRSHPDRAAEIYLKAYSGDHCRVDRVSRGPVNLPNPCLTVLWLVQPDKLDMLFGTGRLGDSGLLPRLMVCHVETEPLALNRSIGVEVPETQLRWRSLVHTLLANYGRRQEPYLLTPTGEAVALFGEHQRRVAERRCRELADADSYAARWSEWAWRLGVVLHAATHAGEAHRHPVGPETASAAIGLADWFAAQQLELMERPRAAARARKRDAILDLLRRQPAVSPRGLQRARIADTATEARALLRQLEAEGKLVGGDHRPPSGGHPLRHYSLACHT